MKITIFVLITPNFVVMYSVLFIQILEQAAAYPLLNNMFDIISDTIERFNQLN